MTTQFQSEDFDRSSALSQTAWALQELQLYGTRAFQDEVDLRPMPEPERLIDAVSDIFDALAATLADTRMEPDLEELLWGQVNLFHRAAARTERLLDDNEVAQHRLQREQDGSEVKSTELERLTAEGTSLVERRHCLDAFPQHEALICMSDPDGISEEVTHSPPRCIDSRLVLSVGCQPSAMHALQGPCPIGDRGDHRRPGHRLGLALIPMPALRVEAQG